jgi:hypothetical protein
MRPSRPSPLQRTREAVPVFAVAGIGIAGVVLAMNILVASYESAASPSPSPTSLPTPTAVPTPFEAVTPVPISTAAPSMSLSPSGRPIIVNSAVSASDPGHVWTVYLGYPAFLAGSTPWASEIDADIFQEVQTRAAQWEAGPASIRQVPDKVNTLSGTYQTEMLTTSLASFTLTWTDESSGGEPAIGLETLNYDLSTGQRIGFDDLFTDPDTALVLISNKALPLLEAQLGADYDQSIAEGGTGPTAANYIHWALTVDGLKFTFVQNQVAPASVTLPSVVIPWAALRPVLSPTGPAAPLAGF